MKRSFLLPLIILLSGCRQQLEVRNGAAGVAISERGKKVLFYQVRPLKIAGAYERAGYVHPLYDLKGNIVTEDGPVDHPYHRGIYWAWHQVLRDGKMVADGWVSENISYRPVDVRTGKKKGRAFIEAELRWSVPGVPGAADIIKELTTIVVHAAHKHYRAVDFTVKLIPLEDGIALGGADDEKGYGGFCLRLQLPEDISFHAGQQRVTAMERAVFAGPWMDFAGSFGGAGEGRSGITVFCQPDASGLWILRERKSMQNPVFPGRVPRLVPREGWTLRYRLIVHDGTLDEQQLDSLYRHYARQ